MALYLIASGAYVGQELAAEFGQLPPAFLPLGEARLYEHQRRLFPAGAPVHITLPESFKLDLHDRRRLDALGIEIVRVPDGLSLGRSVLYAVESVAVTPVPLLLLHGDTLVTEMPAPGGDFIGVSAETDDYSWAEVDVEGERAVRVETISAACVIAGRRPIACGVFGFASTEAFTRAITEAGGDFVAGLNGWIADRRVNAVTVAGWRDFGHSQTYFRSRQAVSTARAFNNLALGPGVVRKSSRDRDKIAAEAAWLKNCPGRINLFAARVLDAGGDDETGYYETAYSYAPTLAELNVFSRVGAASWGRIVRSCRDFLQECVRHQGPGEGGAALRQLCVDKTLARLERFEREQGGSIDRAPTGRGGARPSLRRLAEELAQRIDLVTSRPETVMHGDFCFGNLLYDSRAGRITVIDPRGSVRAGAPSLFGDVRYDLAKLAHSVFGRYDHILAGRYQLAGDESCAEIRFDDGPHQAWLEDALRGLTIAGVDAAGDEVKAITASLFLSMLPLHAERPDRQRAFIANAYRLHGELDGGRP